MKYFSIVQESMKTKTFIVFAEGSEGILEVNFQVHLSTFLPHHLSYAFVHLFAKFVKCRTLNFLILLFNLVSLFRNI